MKRILSGIQPTGNLHLGNYLGAIKNWVLMQNDYDCLFCVVDLHALTVPLDPNELRISVMDTVAMYLACGINEETSAVFPQSMIPEHSELMWILACHTPLGWLNRMTQFKEKAGKKKDQASLGLYGYPVLMAADILLYQSTDVPVGHDQKQHLELARDIAGAFNRFYGKDFFTLPEPRIFGEATRVMSLRDGMSKMSKSDTSDASRINLRDCPDTIAKKIKKAKTDSDPFPISPEGLEDSRPEVANLLNIYAAFTGDTKEIIFQKYGGKNFSDFKIDLMNITNGTLQPIREKFEDLKKNPDYLNQVVEKGASKARAIAIETIKQVREIVGFYVNK
jgi:tryptophanyl-tRNA synthetase